MIKRAGIFKDIDLVIKHFMPNSVITPVSSNAAQVRTQALISWEKKGVDLEPGLSRRVITYQKL